MANMNQVIPLEYARYVLLHPDKDKDWRQHARQLIEWVKTTPKWPKYKVHGATVTTEQGDGKTFCCNLRISVVTVTLPGSRRSRPYILQKQGTRSIGKKRFDPSIGSHIFKDYPGMLKAPFGDQWWFTDEFADGPRRMMDSFWAVPEWAPANESHFLALFLPSPRLRTARAR